MATAPSPSRKLALVTTHPSSDTKNPPMPDFGAVITDTTALRAWLTTSSFSHAISAAEAVADKRTNTSKRNIMPHGSTQSDGVSINDDPARHRGKAQKLKEQFNIETGARRP